MTDNEILEAAINKYGAFAQENMCIKYVYRGMCRADTGY
jgi:DNA transposition AAA+ family ATPase